MTDNSNEQFTVGDMLRDLATRIGGAYIRVFGDPQILYFSRSYSHSELDRMSPRERELATQEMDEDLERRREISRREEERRAERSRQMEAEILEQKARGLGLIKDPEPEYDPWKERDEERRREREERRNRSNMNPSYPEMDECDRNPR